MTRRVQRKEGDEPDKELASPRFSGSAILKEVLNDRVELGQGSSGDHVKRIQEALLALGYALPKHGADGKYGPETAKAVREFQTRYRLQVDGIVGDQTLGLLDAEEVGRATLHVGEALDEGGGLIGGVVGGIVKRIGAAGLDTAEQAAATDPKACPADRKAERKTGCIQPIVIAEDDGSNPTTAPSFPLVQRIWEKCCVNYSVLSTKTVKETDYKTLEESVNNTPTAEQQALFAAAGSSNCIQVFVPATFSQGADTGKHISGGGAAYFAGTANAKIVVVEGAVPSVVAHEVGHAAGFLGHDGNDTVMKPTGAHDKANSGKTSKDVCSQARTGAVLSGTSGKKDCCMFFG